MMDRFYFGLEQYGADGFPKQPEPITERHKREMAEMDERLDNAILILRERSSEGQQEAEAVHYLKEVIAEKVALVLDHEFEWQR